jgi:hypothetical protein
MTTSGGSIRAISPPVDAVRQLRECVVLCFFYDASERRFTLVADYPDKASGSDRAFVALVFDRVVDFVREQGDHERFKRFFESYQAAENEAPIVVQDIQVSEADGSGIFQCWFGPNLGGLGFQYTGLVALTRDARVRNTGKVFVYSDLLSAEVFDFFSPFSNVDIERSLK